MHIIYCTEGDVIGDPILTSSFSKLRLKKQHTHILSSKWRDRTDRKFDWCGPVGVQLTSFRMARFSQLYGLLLDTEPLSGHGWKKVRHYFVRTKYVISFPRNHFVRTKYVISFPRNHFEGMKYVIKCYMLCYVYVICYMCIRVYLYMCIWHFMTMTQIMLWRNMLWHIIWHMTYNMTYNIWQHMT